MSKTLALIHTSMVFLTKETMMQDLFKEIMPDVRLINIVDDSLLPDTMAAGHVTKACIDRMNHYVKAAEQTGADAVFSLCSSLGPAIDIARKTVDIPVVKIDDAMTQAAVEKGGIIGVMATVETTLEPTIALIQEKAAKAQKNIEIIPSLVEGAFEKLMAGDKDSHDFMVAEKAKSIKDQVDTIVFAQASMTRLASSISESTDLPVFTSPRLGIEYIHKVLQSV